MDVDGLASLGGGSHGGHLGHRGGGHDRDPELGGGGPLGIYGPGGSQYGGSPNGSGSPGQDGRMAKPRIAWEVRPFTKESLEKINLRTSNLIRDYGFLPRRQPNLLDGAQLPAKFEPFPPELLGKPVEELDQYVYEKVGEPVLLLKMSYIIPLAHVFNLWSESSTSK